MASPAPPGLAGKPLATVENYLTAASSRRGRQDDWQHELLAFELGREVYAVSILRLRAIVTRRAVTELPRVPAWLLGVMSIRGQIVPLIDLRLRLGLPAPAPGKAARVLVVHREDEPFGLLVDGVRQVVRLRDEELETRPPALAGRDSEFVSGIARPRAGGMLIMLNVDAVLKWTLGRGKGAAR
jgi:purine-binding chemotaxis protein CheW